MKVAIVTSLGFVGLLLGGCGKSFDGQCSIAGTWSLVSTYVGDSGTDCVNAPAVGVMLSDTLTISDGASAGTLTWIRSNPNQTVSGQGTVDESCVATVNETAAPIGCTFTDSTDPCSLQITSTFELTFDGTGASGTQEFDLAYTDTKQQTTGRCAQRYSESASAQ